MDSWWQLGESFGQTGSSLALYQIECAFCGERDNWGLEHSAEKRKPNSLKVLHFDTYKCGNCAGYVMVLWSASEHSYGPMGGGLHNYRILPWPLSIGDGSDNWPRTVSRFWKQAHDSLKNENYDATAMMARSALQTVMRQQGATGPNLYAEINDLADRGTLPTTLKEWAHELRELGNDSAHPSPDDEEGEGHEVDPEDAQDIVNFLDFLLEYTYDVPKRIEHYRARRNPPASQVDDDQASSEE